MLAGSRYFAVRRARSAISLDDARPQLIASRYSEPPSRLPRSAGRPVGESVKEYSQIANEKQCRFLHKYGKIYISRLEDLNSATEI